MTTRGLRGRDSRGLTVRDTDALQRIGRGSLRVEWLDRDSSGRAGLYLTRVRRAGASPSTTEFSRQNRADIQLWARRSSGRKPDMVGVAWSECSTRAAIRTAILLFIFRGSNNPKAFAPGSLRPAQPFLNSRKGGSRRWGYSVRTEFRFHTKAQRTKE